MRRLELLAYMRFGAVTLSGKSRIVLTLPWVRLLDVSKDGRVLLAELAPAAMGTVSPGGWIATFGRKKNLTAATRRSGQPRNCGPRPELALESGLVR